MSICQYFHVALFMELSFYYRPTIDKEVMWQLKHFPVHDIITLNNGEIMKEK